MRLVLIRTMRGAAVNLMALIEEDFAGFSNQNRFRSLAGYGGNDALVLADQSGWLLMLALAFRHPVVALADGASGHHDLLHGQSISDATRFT